MLRGGSEIDRKALRRVAANRLNEDDSQLLL